MTRHYPSGRSRHTRTVRALGGTRMAERAEQLRARGLDTARVVELLGVPADALDAYFALQDHIADAASGWADGPRHRADSEATATDPRGGEHRAIRNWPVARRSAARGHASRRRERTR